MAEPRPYVFTCPACGLFGPAETFSADADNKLYASLLGDIGHRELATSVIHYLGLFRPAHRRLTAPRARKLLEELVPMIKAQQIRRDGSDWTAPPDAWISAIAEMLQLRDEQQIDLPMETHGYLLDVLVSRAKRSAKTVRAEAAQAEQAREAQRRADSQARGASNDEPVSVGTVMRRIETPEERMARIRREEEAKDSRRRPS